MNGHLAHPPTHSRTHARAHACMHAALSTMSGQQPFGLTNTCYFGGQFWDLFPKVNVTSARYHQ